MQCEMTGAEFIADAIVRGLYGSFSDSALQEVLDYGQACVLDPASVPAIDRDTALAMNLALGREIERRRAEREAMDA